MSIRFEQVLVVTIRSLIIAVLLAPIIVTEKTLFPYVVGKSLYIHTLVEVTFALWVVLALRDERYGLPRTWLIAIFFLYVVACFISAVIGVSFQRSFWGDVRRMGGVWDMSHWFLFLVVVASMWRTSRHWRWLLNANLTISLVLGVLGIFQNYGIPLLWYLKQTGRVDATLGNADYVGAYTLVNALVAFAFLAHSFAPSTEPAEAEVVRRGPRRTVRRTQDDFAWLWRSFWVLTILVNLWVLTLSGTRGALAGLVVALFFAGVAYAVLGKRKRLRIVTASLSGAMLASILLVPLAHSAGLMKPLANANPLLRRVDETLAGGISQAYESRRVIVEAGLAAFPSRPVFGWGPENFAVAYDRHGSGYFGEQIADQAHSKPVEELTTKGLVGLSLYLIMIGYSLWAIYRKLRRDPQEELLTLLLGTAFVGYVAQNVFLFDTPATFLQFALLLGWVAANEYAPAVQPAQPPANGSLTRRERRAAESAALERQQGQAQGPAWTEAFRSPIMATTLSVLAVGTALFTIYWINIRSYQLASGFPVQGDTLDGYYQDAKASFAKFPPLATLPRVFLMDTVAANWVSGKGSLQLLAQVQTEGQKAIAAEPQNARNYISLANLMITAAPQNTAILKDSRKLLDAAKAFAPNLPNYADAMQKQVDMEQRLGVSQP